MVIWRRIHPKHEIGIWHKGVRRSLGSFALTDACISGSRRFRSFQLVCTPQNTSVILDAGASSERPQYNCFLIWGW